MKTSGPDVVEDKRSGSTDDIDLSTSVKACPLKQPPLLMHQVPFCAAALDQGWDIGRQQVSLAG